MAKSKQTDAQDGETNRKGKVAKLTESAGTRARDTVQALEQNPVGVLVGGLAVGIVAGALIPRSTREREALAPLGKKLADGTRAAIATARETGKEQLTASVLSPDAAGETARRIFESAIGAAKGEQRDAKADATA